MREIKLKAFDKTFLEIFGEKKVFDVISIDFKRKCVLLDGGKYGEILRNFPEVELVQFTGLKDKNGVEIYEGNVVEYRRSKNVKRRYTVVYDMNYFKLNEIKNNQHSLVTYAPMSIRVIGNIYEDSELLSKD